MRIASIDLHCLYLRVHTHMAIRADDSIYFVFNGTADAACLCHILVDYCDTLPSQPRADIDEQYNQQFARGCSFTMIRTEPEVIQPLEWEFCRGA